MTVGLLLSDYMSRQVLNAVFPMLKSAWGMSDTQLGSLSSVVALIVGLLTFPLSVLADRWGRTQTILLWSSVSLTLSFAIGWLMALPIALLVALACLALGKVFDKSDRKRGAKA